MRGAAARSMGESTDVCQGYYSFKDQRSQATRRLLFSEQLGDADNLALVSLEGDLAALTPVWMGIAPTLTKQLLSAGALYSAADCATFMAIALSQAPVLELAAAFAVAIATGRPALWPASPKFYRDTKVVVGPCFTALIFHMLHPMLLCECHIK